jgi:ABC-type transport system involved in cytochrome c biogenesis permease subunit
MVIGLVGYATLLFNFFGVNILIPGLHSYAGI